MKTVLFQGDSITDAQRNREMDGYRGSGYATLVSARLGFMYPNKYNFINRGVSGNRIVDVLARMKSDIINLSPDYMSILIGVNDVWHELDWQNGVDDELFFKVYSMLIEEVRAALPDIKIMLLEPFTLKGINSDKPWDIFKAEVAKRAASTKRVAEKYGLIFVPLQVKFDEATEAAPNNYWLADGVHPTAAGHELIARQWCEAFDMASKECKGEK